jgi:5,10-methylenetetrahydromethanopterin reductase
MDFGVGIATSGDSWKLAQRAEELGFTHAWFYDTQMLTGDCFVAMGAAALKTSRIRLGTGVLVPSNRIAAVTANAFATLNQMAPGRIDFGVGTGFSARRAMGLGAMKMKDMEEYIRVVYALLAGEIVETEIEGKNRKIQFLSPDLGFINTKDPIRLHVSAYGPRTQKLVARLGAAWMTFIGNVDGGMAELKTMRDSWAEAGNAPGGLYSTAFTAGCVLREGESYDSPRVVDQAGCRAAVLLHRAADEALDGLHNTAPPPPALRQQVDEYIEIARGYQPPDARYLTNHRGHSLRVKPEERHLITGELIRRVTFTATEQELTQRVEALRDAGYSQITVSITPGHEDALDDWTRIKRAFA